MRKFTTLILLLISGYCFGQESVHIQFDIIEKADPTLGQSWDLEYTPYKPMTVVFDGKYLTVRYKESGKFFLQEPVKEWTVVKTYDSFDSSKLKAKNYVLTIYREGKLYYYVIQYSNVGGSHLISLHIPYIAKNYIVFSYTIFQSDFVKGLIQ